MSQQSSLPHVLCRFDSSVDKELFIKCFHSDMALIFCESDQDAEAYLNDSNLVIHALVLDQHTISSTLPAHFKLAKPHLLVIMLHREIELDSIVGLLDKGHVDKCFAKPYNKNLLRSEIFTSYLGITNQTKLLQSNLEEGLKPAVLIVDDEIVATKFLKKQLEKLHCPCDVLIADNAEQALTIFEQYKDRLAIIISDQRMPGMQGNQLLTEIKKHNPYIIRMLTSAYEEVDIALNAVNEGKIYRYIKKPWVAFEFNELIKNALAEFLSRMSSLNNQQTDLTRQYADILRVRRNKLQENLLTAVDVFSGQGTFTYFLDCLEDIKTLSPNTASLKVSQETGIESELIEKFSSMILEKIQVFSNDIEMKISQEYIGFLDELQSLAENEHQQFKIRNSQFDLLLIDCLRTTLESSQLTLSSLEFSLKQGRLFIATKKNNGLVVYKHLLSPLTQITNQMLEQQCELLVLIMLCRKLNLDIELIGNELYFGLTMQLPCDLGG